MEAAQMLYDRYTQNGEVENSQQTEGTVENAKNAIEEAKKNLKENSAVEGGAAGDAPSALPEPEEVAENPLEVVLSFKQNALLGMVTGNAGGLSEKQINTSEAVANRVRETGTAEVVQDVNWYDRVLVLEYLDTYFSDYTAPQPEHALSYEIEYILCAKATDKDNLEGVAGRLLLMREAANVTSILSDGDKRATALAMANALAGFTGNPAIIKVVQIGVVAAWAYVESILDVRTLLAGGKIALLKSDAQWTTQLGSLSQAFGEGARAKECENGNSYQDYLKGFLLTLPDHKLAYRMLDVIEHNIRQQPACQNCRVDFVLCEIGYEMNYMADPLFWDFSVLGPSDLLGLQYQVSKKFSYY